MSLPVVKRLKTTFGQTCKHYDPGPCGSVKMPEVCKAGVRYEDVRVDGEFKYRNEGSYAIYTHGRCTPCHKQYNFAGATCDKAEFATDEEIAAWLEESNRHLRDIGTARRAIIEHCQNKRGVSGVLECPVCKTGKLRYSRASCNGHVHASCSTEDCVRWME